MDEMPRGSWLQYPGCRPDQWLYAPDWNDEDFLARAEALLQALAARYGDDPRLGWIEIGFYGDWGEWHLWKIPNPTPGGAGPISDDNARRLIDAHVRAFPHKRLIVMKDHPYAFGYALSLSQEIGWRNDCLGDPWFSKGMDDRFAEFPWAANRWQTAPVITETCYERPGTGGFQRAQEQVQAYHVAMIGQGNMERWTTFNPTEHAAWTNAVTAAGYRLAPAAVSLPAALRPGETFNVEAVWRNDGNAPAYHERVARLQLEDPVSGATVWTAESVHDLGRILPGTIALTDDFALPSDLSPGAYELTVTVVDPSGYYPPLALAIPGKRANGSYRLGSVQVERP
jgi:hypothetical protein